MPRNPQNPRLSLRARLWAKIAKAGADECWLWTASTGQKDQPVISRGKGRTLSPRRLVWEDSRGAPVPPTRIVSTSCKEPRCLNPAHLYLKPFMDIATRFWSKVRRLDDDDGCWEWRGATDKGYGTVSMLVDGVKMQRRAHRVAWELTYGEIKGHVPGDPDREILIMHLCDNPKCVRPDHLRLGNDRDNVTDCIAKGRNSRGAAHAAAMRAARERRSTDSSGSAEGGA